MSQKFLSSIKLTGLTGGSILKINADGVIVEAVAGTDYITSVSAGNLDSLTDVVITSPSADQILVYGQPVGGEPGVNIWYNKTPNYLTPASSINALGDVSITSVGVGNLLSWNGSNWVNWAPNFLTSYTETDPIYTASSWYTTTNNASNWDTAYGWGNHSGLYANAVHTHSVFTQATSGVVNGEEVTIPGENGFVPASGLDDGGKFLRGDGTWQVVTTDLTGYATETWVGQQGYLTSYTETDPVFKGSAAYGISTENISSWNTMVEWGNHADAGYLTSYTETDPIYTASSWYTTTNNASNWDTAYGWGNHALAGYLTAETDSQTLEWNQGEKTLTISNGNSVDLSQMASVQDVEAYGFITGESDTLHTVTNRGSLTSNTISVEQTTGGGFVYRTDTNWGGWARNGFSFANGSGTLFKSFGAYGGDGNSLSYMYIGTDYTSHSIRFGSDYTYFPGLDLAISNSNNDHGTGTYFRGTTSHFVLGLRDGNTLYLNYGNPGGTIYSYGTQYHNGSLVVGSDSVYTTGGSAKLSVAGDIISFGFSNNDLSYFRRLDYGKFQWQTYNSGNTGEIHLQPYGGNVGIGTASPTQKLEVSGNILASKIGVGGSINTSFDLYNNGTTYLNGQTYLDDQVNITSGYSVNFGTSRIHSTDSSYFMGGNVGIGTTSPTGKLSVNGGISQDNIVGRPKAYWGVGGGSNGAIVISFPGSSSNYGMVHAVVDIYEYNSNNVSTVIVGGHNWGGRWYGYGANTVGYTDKQIRVSYKDGRYAIIIGDENSSWSYGQVVLRKIQNGDYYAGVMNVSDGYDITQTQDLTADWMSENLTGLKTTYATVNGNGSGSSNSLFVNGFITGSAHGASERLAISFNTRLWFYDSNAEIYRSGSSMFLYGHDEIRMSSSAGNISVGNSTWAYSNSEPYVAGQVYNGQAGNSRFMFHSGSGVMNVYTDGNFYAVEGTQKVATETWVAAQGYAVQQDIAEAVSNLVNSSPEALDTLGELANALGNDPNFATTVTNSIAGKVSKSGDTMTGNLTTTGLTVGNGVATGRQPYGPLANANIVLTSSASDSSGVCGIEFTSGNNYPSDGATIYFENNATGGGSERAKLTLRVDNDQEDFIELRAGKVVINANTYSGGGQNPAVIFQHNDTQIASITSGGQIDASGGNSSQWNTAYGWGNHAGLYIPINPDGDGPAWSYSDENPTINGVGIGGTQQFGADGNSLTGGALQARMLNAYDGSVNSTYGYHVGSLNFGNDSGTHTTTQVINSAGTFVGPQVSTGKIYGSKLLMGSGGTDENAVGNGGIRIGRTDTNYTHGSSWSGTSSTMFIDCSDVATITIHDSGHRLVEYMTYDGAGTNTIFTGRNIGWGTTNWSFGGDVSITGSLSASGYNKSNWDTAYGWGNHATANYWVTSNSDPQIVAASSVTFQYDVEIQGQLLETSSIRFKENIVDLEPVGDKVSKLRPVRYNKIGTDVQEIGLIAEEVAELFPEVVHYNEDGEAESLNYTRLSVLLLQTVKELSDRIQKLENK